MSQILSVLQQQVWAVESVSLGNMAKVLVRHAMGDKLPVEQIALITTERDRVHARMVQVQAEANSSAGVFRRGSVAWIGIGGVLVKRASQVNGASQPRGTSYEAIKTQFRAAVGNPEVRSILLHIDSPGGAVDGIMDLAAEIRKSPKPVWAICDGMAASGGYWLASSASKVLASSVDALIGSIGVYIVVVDTSAKAEKEGVKVHLIASGGDESIKGQGTDGVPVKPDAIANWQRIVNKCADHFYGHVVNVRKLAKEQQKSAFTGGVFMASDAYGMGLIDGVDTVDNTLAAMEAKFGNAAK